MKYLNYDNNDTFDCYKSRDKVSELTLDECGYEKCSPKHYWEGRRDFYLFHYILKGKGILKHNNEIKEIQGGQCFFIKPNEEIYYEADENEPWEYIWIGFGGLSAKSLMKKCTLSDKIVQDAKNVDLLLSLYKEMISNSRKGEFANLLVLSVLYRFIVYLLENYGKEDYLEMNIKEQNFKKIVKMIDLYYKNKISVKKIAQIVGYEKTYVYRLFQEFMGMPPKQYVCYLRLRAAIQEIRLLDEENMEKIAINVGFDEYLTFYRSFKKFLGMSPDEYRRKVKEDGIINIELKEFESFEQKINKFRGQDDE